MAKKRVFAKGRRKKARISGMKMILLMISLASFAVLVFFIWRPSFFKTTEILYFNGRDNRVLNDVIEDDALIYEKRESKKEKNEKNVIRDENIETVNNYGEKPNKIKNKYRNSDRDYLNGIIKKVND